MACFWIYVSHLLLLLSPRFQGIQLGHAEIAQPVYGPSVFAEFDLTKRTQNNNIMLRNPDDGSDPGDPSTTTSSPSGSDNGSTTSSDGSSTSDGSSDPSSQTTTTSDNSNNGGFTYDQPVTDYQPSVDPIENDSDYPNYNDQVMNTSDGGDYQYEILINADVNSDTIDLGDQYGNYDTSTMLKCTSLCNQYNTDNGGTVQCEAVVYYGQGECYLLTDLYQDASGRYTYYSPGGITGLVLRSPTYPTPSELSPSPPDTYTTTTTTDAMTTASQVTYSVTTITPTDSSGTTTVNVYIASCPATTY